MKNFKKQFMELTLGFAIINSVAVVKAFAQEIDYNQINDANSEMVRNQSREAKEPSKTVKFLFNHNLREISLPAKRKLTSIEKDQKKLLECALKFVDKRKGLYQGPAILQNILVKAMDADKLTADSYVLSTVTDECWDAYNGLTKFSKSKTKERGLQNALEALKMETAADLKVANFIRDGYLGDFKCIGYNVSASAAFLFGANAGGSLLKCINPAGERRNYIGPKLGFLLGVGAKVSYSKSVAEKNFVSGVVAGSASAEDSSKFSDVNLTILLGAESWSSENNWTGAKSETEAQTVGLSLGLIEGYGTFNFRVFNSARNWSYVIDQLK